MSLCGIMNYFIKAGPLWGLLLSLGGGAYGGAISPAVEVRPDPHAAPRIIEHPQDLRIPVGGTALFAVKAEGRRLRYQWIVNGKPLEGAVDPSIRVDNISIQYNGTRVQVIVSNRHGKVQSREALLTVYDNGSSQDPIITSFTATPEVVEKGEKVTLHAVFSGGTAVIRPGSHPIESGQSLAFYPTETTQYRLRVVSPDGKKVRARVTVTVKDGNTPSPSPQPTPTPNPSPNPTPVPTPVATLHSARCRHTATLLSNGKVLMVGGQDALDNRKSLDDVELFDPTTNKSLVLRKLKTARTGHTATLLKNGHVFLAGGLDKEEAFSSTWEIYDPVAGKVLTHGDMEVVRAYHTATLMEDGKVLLVGGSNNAPVAAELFDPEKGASVKLPKTRHIYCQHTATLFKDGKVLIAGGSNRKHEALSYGEIYDPVAKTFTSVGDLVTGRFNHTATLLADGKVLLTGGYTGSEEINNAELYDPAKKTFTKVNNNMQAKRSGHTATLLANDKVLLVGAAPQAEVFDPVQGQFVSDVAVTPRRFHTATLLKSGRVLLAAGQKENTLLDTVEYYGASNAPDEDEEPPVITAQPASKTATVGSKVTFSVVAEGKGLHYKWFKNNVSIHGATSDSYTIDVVKQEHNGAAFTAEVSNAGGSVMSNSATLTVVASSKTPVIESFVATPTTITAGQEVKLTARFSNGTAVITPGNLAVNSDISLLLKPTATTTYLLTVTNEDGSVTATATVTVNGGGSTPGGSGTPGAFAPSGTMKVERVGHTATLLPNGKVLMAGGTRTNELSTVMVIAELYDPATGQFTATGNLNQARRGHTATLLTNGKVLIAGGSSNALEPYASAEVYDPVSGTFSQVSNNMSVGRAYHTATTLSDGTVLVVGGGAGAELYNPKTNAFTTIASPAVKRSKHTATLLGSGKVLLIGGWDAAGNLLTSAEIYDPAAKSFAATGNLGIARKGHSATLLTSGLVLVVGGMGDIDPLASSEVYDQATGTFRPTGSMAAVRSEVVATLLRNGQVLISGFGTYTELYDPATATFGFGGNLSVSRSYHTSTLLFDGTVLLCGGAGDKVTLATTERYTPAK